MLTLTSNYTVVKAKVAIDFGIDGSRTMSP